MYSGAFASGSGRTHGWRHHLFSKVCNFSDWAVGHYWPDLCANCLVCSRLVLFSSHCCGSYFQRRGWVCELLWDPHSGRIFQVRWRLNFAFLISDFAPKPWGILAFIYPHLSLQCSSMSRNHLQHESFNIYVYVYIYQLEGTYQEKLCPRTRMYGLLRAKWSDIVM